MTDPVTIAILSAAASAGSSLMSTAQQRAVGKAQAQALEVDASVARRQAGLETEALGRETRRQFGELRAAGAQAGLLDSVTFGDVYKQAATAAELDALSLAYQGELHGPPARHGCKASCRPDLPVSAGIPVRVGRCPPDPRGRRS